MPPNKHPPNTTIMRIAIENGDSEKASKILSEVDNYADFETLIESLDILEIEFLEKLNNIEFNRFLKYKTDKASEFNTESSVTKYLLHKLRSNAKDKEQVKLSLEGKITQLTNELNKLKPEKQKEIETKIKDHLSGFVETAVKRLSERASNYAKNAKHWSNAGILSIILVIAASYFYMHNEITEEIVKNDISTNLLIYISAKGILLIAAILYIAKYSFFSSRSYTHEAIKCEDREHAIRFGQLYLEIFGGTVERSEVIKIFENWNISNESAFAAPPIEKEDTPYEKIIEHLTSQKNKEKTDQ